MNPGDVCSRCISHSGGCCTGVKLCIHVNELGPFLENQKKSLIPAGHEIIKWHADKKLFLYKSGKEACMFLGKDNRCSIYERRPLVCRTFPILWTGKEKDGVHSELVVDLSCPLAHTVPLTEMAQWAKNDEKGIRQMGSLVVDRRKKQYCNLHSIRVTTSVLEILEGKNP